MWIVHGFQNQENFSHFAHPYVASQVAEWCAKWPNQPKMRFVFEARLNMGTPKVKVYIGRKDGSWLRIEGSKHVVLRGFRHGEWGFEAPNMGDISRWMIWPFRQHVSSGSVVTWQLFLIWNPPARIYTAPRRVIGIMGIMGDGGFLAIINHPPVITIFMGGISGINLLLF